MTELSKQGSKKTIVFLFPGNSIDYSETLEKLKRNHFFQKNCKTAKINKENIINASKVFGNSIDRELSNQVLIYTICCSICDYYKSNGILPDLITGYSMGVYAGFYAAETYNFETGLSILEKAFHLTKDLYVSKKKQKFGMGVIIGLTENDLFDMFKETGGIIDIASFNGTHNFVIVGEQEKVEVCIKKAEAMGAFKANKVDTEFGFHTPVLKEISDEFRKFLNGCSISNPVYRFLSAITIDPIINPNEVTDEIVKNMYYPIRWASFIDTLSNTYKTLECYEVGPGDALNKITRYINRKVKVRPFN